MVSAFDVEEDSVLPISAKTGAGVPEVLHSLVTSTPSPTARASQPLRVLLFDSWYDEYRGVLCLMQAMCR